MWIVLRVQEACSVVQSFPSILSDPTWLCKRRQKLSKESLDLRPAGRVHLRFAHTGIRGVPFKQAFKSRSTTHKTIVLFSLARQSFPFCFQDRCIKICCQIIQARIQNNFEDMTQVHHSTTEIRDNYASNKTKRFCTNRSDPKPTRYTKPETSLPPTSEHSFPKIKTKFQKKQSRKLLFKP